MSCNQLPSTGVSLWVARISGVVFLVGIVVASALTSGTPTTQAVDYLNTTPSVEYVGDEPCRACHQARYESFKRTGMRRSMSTPATDSLGALSKPVTLRSALDGHVFSVYGRNGKL